MLCSDLVEHANVGLMIVGLSAEGYVSDCMFLSSHEMFYLYAELHH